MSQESLEHSDQAESQVDLHVDNRPVAAKLVPVAESIKYRRRAQQAEAQIQEVEQQLGDLQAQLEDRNNQLASAEAQRDESRQQLTFAENRLLAERRLAEVGVVDIETATDLLAKRINLHEEIDSEALARHVEELLLDKSFLLDNGGMPAGSLPPQTASPRSQRQSATAQLTAAAQRAALTGNRRDVAEYLRLRRQTSPQ